MKKKSACCIAWESQVRGMEINTIPYLQKDNKFAEYLQALLSWQIGNFCPTCGYKIKKSRKEIYARPIRTKANRHLKRLPK